MIDTYRIKKLFYILFLYFGLVLKKATSKSKISSFYKKLKVKKCDLIILGKPHHDGSYVIPDNLKNIKHCISFGVGNNIDFELDLAKKKIHTTCFDGTVNNLPLGNPYIKFVKKNVMPTDSFLNNLYPKGVKNIRSIDINTALSSVFNKHSHNDEFILKIDIEGHEYKNILNLNEELLDKFKILVIEFHFLNLITDKDKFNMINQTFQKLLKKFHIVSINQTYDDNYIARYGHSFLYTTLEISFLRKDGIEKIEKVGAMKKINFNMHKKEPNRLIYKTLF